jgi:hypothetical protein
VQDLVEQYRFLTEVASKSRFAAQDEFILDLPSCRRRDITWQSVHWRLYVHTLAMRFEAVGWQLRLLPLQPE